MALVMHRGSYALEHLAISLRFDSVGRPRNQNCKPVSSPAPCNVSSSHTLYLRAFG